MMKATIGNIAPWKVRKQSTSEVNASLVGTKVLPRLVNLYIFPTDGGLK
jgi:hypothetical protein